MARIENEHGCYIVNGEFLHTDWDWPSAASGLGWSIARVQHRNGRIVHLARRGTGQNTCEHRCTDGTVACPDCGIPPSAFIRAAGEYLDSRM